MKLRWPSMSMDRLLMSISDLYSAALTGLCKRLLIPSNVPASLELEKPQYHTTVEDIG